ncbi:hypothetical protein BDW71DRAFT_183026 [Aspergillus fruticulosus]
MPKMRRKGMKLLLSVTSPCSCTMEIIPLCGSAEDPAYTYGGRRAIQRQSLISFFSPLPLSATPYKKDPTNFEISRISRYQPHKLRECQCSRLCLCCVECRSRIPLSHI